MGSTAQPGDELNDVRIEWLRRVEAEYRSASFTHHLTHWLIQVAAPIELIRAGAKIVDDELVHSEMSHAVYVAAGGQEPPKLERESLALPARPGEPLEARVTRTCVEMFCLGETVAVRLFSKLREGCDQPAARDALDRILRDEVTHRDFGWTLLDWIFGTSFEPEARKLVARDLPDSFRRLQTNYSYGSLDDDAPRTETQRHWGLMPRGAYARAVQETFARDYAPLFGEFDIDAGAAWSAAGGRFP